ncbi:MAG: hypothetical protein ACRCVN_01180 [Spirochaetia bacterium]
MKKFFSILIIYLMISAVFVACSAPSGASSSSTGTEAGDGTNNGTEENVPMRDPVTISVDGTVATGLALDRILNFEWKVSASSVVPSVVFTESRAIYIKIDQNEPSHTSWGTWLYNEASKVFDARTAATVFFQADDEGMWTGKLVMNSGEVLSAFEIEDATSWTNL